MAGGSELRRRIAVALVALVAAAATIATSQAVPEAQLKQSSGAAVVLDAGAPRAIARFVLTLSPEALSAGGSPTGAVTFAIDATNRVGEASTISGEPVEISAALVGDPQPPQTDAGSPYWSIGELCKPAGLCRRVFDVTVDWLQPQPGSALTVSVRARVLITYVNVTGVPIGASAIWETGEFAAVATVPGLSVRADLGSISLGRDSPLAARHVLLRGSAAILADPTLVDVTAYVRVAPSGDQPPPAIVTLVPDDSADQPVSAGDIIQPFAGCTPAKECVRGFTILARWSGFAVDDRVDLDWSFEALARFGGGNGIPDGATLTADVNDAVDLGPQSPRLHAEAEGSFDLQAQGDLKIGRVKLDVSSPALGNAFFGAAPPAVAVVRLRAAVKDSAVSAVPTDLRAWVVAPNDLGRSALALADDGTELQTVVFALDRCRDDGRCGGWIDVSVSNWAGRDATISWQVSIDLPVPQAALAAGKLQIEVVDAP